MKRQSQYPGLHEHHCPYWSFRITVTWSHRKKKSSMSKRSWQYIYIIKYTVLTSVGMGRYLLLPECCYWYDAKLLVEKKRPERKAKKRGKQCLRLTKPKKIVWSCQKHFQMSRNGERNVSRRNKRREIHILQRKTRNIKWIKNHIHNLYNVFGSCFFFNEVSL